MIEKTKIFNKQCTKCKEIKDVGEFYKKKNGYYDSWCDVCRKQKRNYIELNTLGSKQCQICKEFKDIKEYGRANTCKDGYRNICKECIGLYKKQYHIRNKKQIHEKKKQYSIDNKKRLSKYKKLYYSSHASYETYAHQLTIDEEPRLADDGVSLEVRCKYCGKYFKPKNLQIIHRINSIDGKGEGENNLYCSDNCKNSCSIYNRSKYPKGFKPDTSREVQPALRKLVLERDNWTCQKCGNSTDDYPLHCHHFEGIEINPVESADVDNCVTLCKKCHKAVHKQDGCNMKRERC